MKAIEFKSRIKNNRIQIPQKAQSELMTNNDVDVRVILLIDDSEINDSFVFQESAGDQFLKGYADSDSVYDNG